MSVDCVNYSNFYVPTFYLVPFIHLTLLIYFIIKYKIMQSEKRLANLLSIETLLLNILQRTKHQYSNWKIIIKNYKRWSPTVGVRKNICLAWLILRQKEIPERHGVHSEWRNL